MHATRARLDEPGIAHGEVTALPASGLAILSLQDSLDQTGNYTLTSRRPVELTIDTRELLEGVQHLGLSWSIWLSPNAYRRDKCSGPKPFVPQHISYAKSERDVSRNV